MTNDDHHLMTAAEYQQIAEDLLAHHDNDGEPPDQAIIDRAVSAATAAVELSAVDDPDWAYRNWLLGAHLDRRLVHGVYAPPEDIDERANVLASAVTDRDRLIECLTVWLDTLDSPADDVESAFVLGEQLVIRGELAERYDDVLAGVRLLDLCATKQPDSETLSAAALARIPLAELSERAEDVRQVIFSATTALDAGPFDQTITLRLADVRLAALQVLFGNDAKAAVAAFPKATEWIEQAAAAIIATAQDRNIDQDVVAIAAGSHITHELWLAQRHSIAVNSEFDALVSRTRPLLSLAANISNPPFDDWRRGLAAQADIVNYVAATTGNGFDQITADGVADMARSATDPGLRERFSRIFTLLSGAYGISAGNLHSTDAAAHGFKQRAAASADSDSQDYLQLSFWGRFHELATEWRTNLDVAKLSDQFGELTKVLSFDRDLKADNIPIVTFLTNFATALSKGELPHVDTTSVPPDDPWLPVWRLAELAPRFVMATRNQRFAEVPAIVQELERVRASVDPTQPVVSHFVNMVFAMLDDDLAAARPGDVVWLDAAVASQERVLAANRSLMPAETYVPATSLARLLRRRGTRDDLTKSRALAVEALACRTWRVLVQSTTEDAMKLVRNVVTDTDEFLTRCLEDHAYDDLVRLLDAERALVLHGANINRAVADRLAELGAQELATRWVASGGDELIELPGQSAADPLPTDMRVRALRSLDDTMFRPPTVAEMQRSLAVHGSDVLIYLVPPGRGRQAFALAVPRDGQVDVVPLPELSVGARSPVANYIEAYNRWQNAKTQEEQVVAMESWHTALTGLCGWAWRAVSAEILQLAKRYVSVGRTPRVVLTPMGVLGMVPWHATYRMAAEGQRRYLIQDICVSYTTSARMLAEATARPPVVGTVALIGDPAEDLEGGAPEVGALHQQFYPTAKILGNFGRHVDAGTPADVIELLRGGVKLIHFACHATAHVAAPHKSSLHLAGMGRASKLTAETMLALNPIGELNIGIASLLGCTTSLSGADYDEALSLSSTFLVIGARSVVGSLWMVPDRHTAYLSYLFHRNLAAGMGSAESLRQAQLWMLDPKSDISELSKTFAMVEDAKRAKEEISEWAGFLHMGNQ